MSLLFILLVRNFVAYNLKSANTFFRYSKPTNNNPSSSFAPPAPLGVVKNVGNVLEFIGNVRKCETPKGVILFVTTDNKTFNDLETSTNRQTMIDKGYVFGIY